ncbi:hypothetical protein TNCV_2319861 [Trichonephila clavipes]|nr:hypothetical protein TNCV_2319861 [Trichonephila clavipes]
MPAMIRYLDHRATAYDGHEEPDSLRADRIYAGIQLSNKAEKHFLKIDTNSERSPLIYISIFPLLENEWEVDFGDEKRILLNPNDSIPKTPDSKTEQKVIDNIYLLMTSILSCSSAPLSLAPRSRVLSVDSVHWTPDNTYQFTAKREEREGVSFEGGGRKRVVYRVIVSLLGMILVVSAEKLLF